MSLAVQAIIFAFDYALVDSSRVSAACINRALTALELPRVSLRQAGRTVNLSLDETYQAITGRDDPREAKTFKQVFRECARDVMVPLTDVFPYVPDMAIWLREQGIKLAIVSRKERELIVAVLENAELGGVFEAIVGRDELERPKPDPSGILLALQRLGVQPEQALYVGDSVSDAEAARQAQVRFVGVLSGITPFRDLAQYEPVAILGSVAELPAWLTGRICVSDE